MRRAAARPDPEARRGEAVTRERLLDAATALFAEHGFRHVTVRDICQRAAANVAAVNYHFGDKERLYRVVVERAIDTVREFDAASRNVSPRATPRERLLHYAKSYLVLADNAEVKQYAKQIREIFRRELSEPSAMRERLVAEVLTPRWRFLAEIVKDVLGAAATKEVVADCVFSIQAQCLIPVATPALASIRLETRADRERFAEHVVTFSLAGMRARAAEAKVSTGRGTSRRAASRANTVG